MTLAGETTGERSLPSLMCNWSNILSTMFQHSRWVFK